MGTATLRVNGRSYRLGCEEGEEDRLIELARYVDECVEKVRTQFGQVGDDRLLVMSALVLTDELFETREKLTELSELVKKRLGKRGKSPNRHDEALDQALDALTLDEAESNMSAQGRAAIDEQDMASPERKPKSNEAAEHEAA